MVRRGLHLAWLWLFLASAVSLHAQSRSAASLLQGARTATGGNAWNSYAECVSDARIQVLVNGRAASGNLRTFENLRTGAVIRQMAIPAFGVRRADGLGLQRSWTSSRTGGVAAHPAHDPWQVDERYLTSRGYWRPNFGGARTTLLAPEAEDGAIFDRIQIRVPGGHGFVLWIRRSTHRIERLEWNGMRDYSDFRRVGGVLLPFTERDTGEDHQVTQYVSRRMLKRLHAADFAVPGAAGSGAGSQR